MYSVTDAAFRPYGRVLPLDTAEFVRVIGAQEATPAGQVVYEPSVAAFEALDICRALTDGYFGGMPVELGHCSGFNEKLNAVEYHRSSEVNLAATDLVLMVGRQQDIDWETLTYDAGRIERFFVPQGTAVELYATTLHYAPCRAGGKEFRCGVALPRGTNEPVALHAAAKGEDRLLFARNKWLIGHAESGLEKDGAWIGIRGENVSL